MDEIKQGVAAGAALALEDAEDFSDFMPRAEQLPLISTAPAAEIEPEAAQARSAGRPKGSPNKRTAQIRDFLLARYPHPLIGLAEIYSRPTKDLAEELDCDRAEALKIQANAAVAVLPYVESKMPQKLDVDSKGHLTLVLGELKPTRAAEVTDGSITIEAEMVDITESDENAAKSES